VFVFAVCAVPAYMLEQQKNSKEAKAQVADYEKRLSRTGAE
jgi:hypothetical protein